jgi:hypothetical protein
LQIFLLIRILIAFKTDVCTNIFSPHSCWRDCIYWNFIIVLGSLLLCLWICLFPFCAHLFYTADHWAVRRQANKYGIEFIFFWIYFFVLTTALNYSCSHLATELPNNSYCFLSALQFYLDQMNRRLSWMRMLW